MALGGGCGGHGGGEPALPGTIVFSAGVGAGDLFVVDADGSHLRQLTRGDAPEQSPSWAPDGNSIVYVRATGKNGALYRIDAEGGRPTKVYAEVEFAAGLISDPAWSPDGKTIAFTSSRNGTPEIWTYGLDGTLIEVTRHFGVHPSWSPDGRRLVYSGLENGRSAIFVVGRDGRGERVVARARVSAESPAWSPDGKWIAFRSLNEGWRTHEVDSLLLVAADGTSRRHLAEGGAIFPTAWSPGSDAVLYLGVDGYGPDGRRQLFTVPLDGGSPRPVAGTSGALGDASWHR